VNWVTSLAGFAIVLVSGGLMLAFAAIRRKSPAQFRDIPAFARLRDAIGRAVEEGGRLHVSLGRSGLTTSQSASALAGLAMLRRAADLTAASDKTPVATAGEGVVAILSQDTLQTAFQAATGLQYQIIGGQLTGLTPFSYAAGTLPVILDEQVSANVLMGNYGIEAGLLTDAAERSGAFTLAGSDNLSAQAVLYANAQYPLIGEELYAAPAYIQAGPLHSASLRVQDILRWLIIVIIIAGAFLKLVGLL
jgi:hypothetical protein